MWERRSCLTGLRAPSNSSLSPLNSGLLHCTSEPRCSSMLALFWSSMEWTKLKSIALPSRCKGRHPRKMLEKHIGHVPLCMAGGVHHGDLGNLVDLGFSATLAPQAQVLHRLPWLSIQAPGGAIGASTAGHSQSQRLSCPRTAQSVLCLRPKVPLMHSTLKQLLGAPHFASKSPLTSEQGGASFPVIFHLTSSPL